MDCGLECGGGEGFEYGNGGVWHLPEDDCTRSLAGLLGEVGRIVKGIGEVLDPLALEPGIRDSKSPSVAEAIEGFGWSEAVGAEQTGDQEARATDSGIAMSGDRFARPEIAVEEIEKLAEIFYGGGNGVVGDGKPVVVDADLAGELGFVFQAEDAGFVRGQE